MVLNKNIIIIRTNQTFFALTTEYRSLCDSSKWLQPAGEYFPFFGSRCYQFFNLLYYFTIQKRRYVPTILSTTAVAVKRTHTARVYTTRHNYRRRPFVGRALRGVADSCVGTLRPPVKRAFFFLGITLPSRRTSRFKKTIVFQRERKRERGEKTTATIERSMMSQIVYMFIYIYIGIYAYIRRILYVVIHDIIVFAVILFYLKFIYTRMYYTTFKCATHMDMYARTHHLLYYM